MTRLEKVMAQREEIEEILINDYCPSDFGVDDSPGWKCIATTRDCEACWNEEVKK